MYSLPHLNITRGLCLAALLCLGAGCDDDGTTGDAAAGGSGGATAGGSPAGEPEPGGSGGAGGVASEGEHVPADTDYADAGAPEEEPYGGEPMGGAPAGGGGGDAAGGEAPDVDPGGEQSAPEPGQLTAGEWRDLEHWDFWLGLFQEGPDGAPNWSSMITRWGFHAHGRVGVQIVRDGSPVIDAPVELVDASGARLWAARTDNFGEAELFAGMWGAAVDGPLEVRLQRGQQIFTAADVTPGLARVHIEVDEPEGAPMGLDLMLIVDTTGSMCDELSYLQSELANVIEIVRREGVDDVRLGISVYRDVGDEYVLRSFQLTDEIDGQLEALRAQRCDGGGDYPEALHAALEDAAYEQPWRPSARARLAFVALDAPAHDAVKGALHQAVYALAEQGVRLIPIAASGVDKETEFLLRFMAIATGGTYVFLTNHSGIGGDHIEPTIGPYEVERLNALMARLINEAVR